MAAVEKANISAIMAAPADDKPRKKNCAATLKMRGAKPDDCSLWPPEPLLTTQRNGTAKASSGQMDRDLTLHEDALDLSQ